ncbi:MAG: hypothetical protein Unbinned4497contig1000_4 [Prokaryotic dsDNA virus sp.]|nr:MAG: hypothetical protein Unbinned4497contig1000_4 [Prokaryotic dsDNA virus sp.]
MFRQYVITVTETTTSRDGQCSHICDKRYVNGVKGDMLELDCVAYKTFDMCTDAESFIEQLPVSRSWAAGKYINTYVYNVEAIDYTHANFHGYSDKQPYEIVRVISPRTLEVRLLDAELDPTWKPETVKGGFSGYTVNNHQQKWLYNTNAKNDTVRIRRRKDGYYYSSIGRHALATAPSKFHDYNF